MQQQSRQPPAPLQEYLDRLIEDLRPIRHGQVNPVTEQVAQPDPDAISLTLTTVSGNQYSAGDTDTVFAIQSIAKVFAYGIALDDLGPEAVREKVDVEPSGDPFNEISLQQDTGRPDNPFINAGAIATVGLIKGRGGRSRIERVLHVYEEAAAGCTNTDSPDQPKLKVHKPTFKAENRQGHRNRALAWLLRSFNIIETDPEPIVQDYFRECSVRMTTQQLSMMAATLANRGVNPTTGRQVFTPETVRQVLSVMSTCGMYDDAGNWAIAVGLPAKSGVDGGIMVVVPGQAGIGVVSPPLDEHGTSVRGYEALVRLTDDLGLHYADSPPLGRSTLRATYSLTDAFSGVVRSSALADTTEEYGERVQIIEIAGDLGFAETEAVQREIVDFPDEIETVILDTTNVDEFGRSAIRVLAVLADRLTTGNRDLVIIDHDDRLIEHMLDFAAHHDHVKLTDPRQAADAAAEGVLDLTGGPAHADADPTQAPITGVFRLFHNRSSALEWAEHRLAQRHNLAALPQKDDRQEAEDSPLFEFLHEADVAELVEIMEPRSFAAGEVIRRTGQPFGGIYFIQSGRVEAAAQGAGGVRYRQSYLSPGMTFGEIALGRDGRQVSTIRAVDDVECLVLTAEMIDQLAETNPGLAIKLWTALTREAYTVLEQSSREAGAREE